MEATTLYPILRNMANHWSQERRDLEGQLEIIALGDFKQAELTAAKAEHSPEQVTAFVAVLQEIKGILDKNKEVIASLRVV
jgi:hypothetical protein